MAHPSLADLEKAAAENLDPELREHSKLAMETFLLIDEALGRLPEVPVNEIPQAQKVCEVLLVRLANDLRTLSLLAHRGYAVQSAAMVATMYEVAFTIGYIGSDEARAQAWIDHEDPTRSFRDARTLTDDVIRRLNLPNHTELVSKHYQTYRQLCMAKHANPLFQMQHGGRLDGQDWVLGLGPDTGEAAIRAIWFAFEHAIGLVLVAVRSFAIEQLKVSEDDSLVADMTRISSAWKQLNLEAVSRWGVTDPFPGKWRA